MYTIRGRNTKTRGRAWGRIANTRGRVLKLRGLQSATLGNSTGAQAAASGLGCYSMLRMGTQGCIPRTRHATCDSGLRPGKLPAAYAPFRTFAAPASPVWPRSARHTLRRPGVPVSAKSGPRPRPRRRQAFWQASHRVSRSLRSVFRRQDTAKTGRTPAAAVFAGR